MLLNPKKGVITGDAMDSALYAGMVPAEVAKRDEEIEILKQ
jgi:hypothetical protein